MQPSVPPIPHPRRDRRPDWRWQALALGGLALIGTLPFWWTDLDVRAAALFYHPGAEDPWWESGRGLWVFLYQASPLIAGLILIGSLLTVAAGGIWRQFRPVRRYALLLLGATLLGPGLVVNGVFKEHWGRPRPHQTLELGGTQVYVPPLAHTAGGLGKSFPCGHSSVGFTLGAFFLIWQRRRPRLAVTALLGSIVLGALLGIGRMTAGDHFLSDVIWSAVLAWGVAGLLYYGLLRIPQWEDATADRPPPAPRPLRHPILSLGTYGLAAAAMVFGVLLLTPVEETRNLEFQTLEATGGPRTLRLMSDAATLTLFPVSTAGPAAVIRLKGRGFGLPGSRVQGTLDRAGNILTYTVAHSGVFTEQDSTLTVGIDPAAWERVELATGVGDIRVQPLGLRAPELTLTTGKGVVLDENGPKGAPQ